MRELDPIQRFSLWFRSAIARCPGSWLDPSSMTLATSTKNGEVSARIVLLKNHGPEGFTFYTNYTSRKGKQLSENPRAALVFYWPYLRRQIRIEGTVQRTSTQESQEYFGSRPRLYQLAATVSQQSQVIRSRQFLVDRFRAVQRRLTRQPVPLPE